MNRLASTLSLILVLVILAPAFGDEPQATGAVANAPQLQSVPNSELQRLQSEIQRLQMDAKLATAKQDIAVLSQQLNGLSPDQHPPTTTDGTSRISNSGGSNSVGYLQSIPDRFDNDSQRDYSPRRDRYSRPGLLGKRYFSAQFVASTATRPETIDDFKLTETGYGGTAQLNVPLFSQESSGGVDLFGTFVGQSSSAKEDGVHVADARLLTGNFGLSLFIDASESVRPFAQLGVNIDNVTAKFPNGASVAFPSETSLLLGFGIESELTRTVASRIFISPDWDGLETADLNGELFIQPDDGGPFLRLTVRTTLGDDFNDVFGAIGVGFEW